MPGGANARRWFWRARGHQTSIDEETPEGGAPFELEDLSATPFEQLQTREVRAVVQNALTQVPRVFGSAVILRDMEGLAYEEIAEVLEVSVGTVKSRILRGRRVLRGVLEPLLAQSGKQCEEESAVRNVSVRGDAPRGSAFDRQHSSATAAGLTMARRSPERSSAH